ncbi:hypothetical protein RFI_33003 [Reticulomyxa filosa]|uniref:Uncharacterized protein n=1 Tax=Reticulomyxa filosa TaxID=46433 RepID=X6LS06_RETFI|nr:hypothetical protein RFI_33003 [Reticulomyxa filosa]|eukprot:ETO04394.1 hypothetical protein RFI_33003 [Reticulomyxa filosa]
MGNACYGFAALEKKEKVKHKQMIIEKFEQRILNADLCYQSKQRNDKTRQQVFIANKTIDFGFFLKMLDINMTSNLLLSNLLTLYSTQDVLFFK